MKIEARIVGSQVILNLIGRVNATELRETIAALRRQSNCRQFILDVRGVSELDSEALGEIVRSYVSAGREGGSLKLVNFTPRLRDLLSDAKLSALFEGTEGEEQAGVGSRLKPRRPRGGQTVALSIPFRESESG